MSNSQNLMPAMSFGGAIKTCFCEYATFSGRASRTEFWWFALLYGVLLLIPVINVTAFMVMSVPMLAVTWRRLHDVGKTGLWSIVPLAPSVLWGYLSLLGCDWVADWWFLPIFGLLQAVASITLLSYLVMKGDAFNNGYVKSKSPFGESIKICFHKYGTFKGRASRAEYWWFTLLRVIMLLICSVSVGASQGVLEVVELLDFSNNVLLVSVLALGFVTFWSCLGVAAMVLPGLAVTWRRLHDIGKGGGWFFICLIPYVGELIFLIFAIRKGESEKNRFGEPSKLFCDSAA